MPTYRQLIRPINEATSHLTFPFPFTFGQQTAHRCWVFTGHPGDTGKRSNFKQHFWHTTWSHELKKWLQPRTKFAADIILIYYTTDNQHDKNINLPQLETLNFADCPTPQHIYDFINPSLNPSLNPALLYQPSLTHPLHTRYFNSVQRQLLLKALANLDVVNHPHNLWSEPTDPAGQQALALVNKDILQLQLQHQLEKQTKRAVSKTPTAIATSQQSAFFKLYTRGTFAFERQNDLGWPDPTSLIARELQTLDEYGRNHPTTIERHAKWELVFAHWDNLQYLATHHLFNSAEIDYLAALIEQVTNHNPNHTKPNPTNHHHSP